MGKKLGEDFKIRSYVVLAIFIKAAVIFLIVTALFPGCNKGGAETSAPAAPSTAVNQPAVGVPEIERGKTVFMAYCTVCHGEKGMGDGPASSGLSPRPLNFTIKSAWMTYNNDEATLKVIRAGGYIGLGRPSSMPAFGQVLTEQQIKEVMIYEKSLAK
ncbi:MAG: Cytochrome c class I [Candidatus Azambacteria bacterium GW2011_GWB2_46_37]|uniref:Cytochrome c class I n=10 Tax=Candidatus Azamiibacteriota TaxID=1752741 RepID=A0A0G1Q5X7_9BACT|nr:MAG: Cytochrome c class I [Candidatus Azambacteria bacterium GW2011_GWC1_46_13]KKU36602.1 MAG: Cytochrome c class I [Candidatus Azambacteria bacterium GW2011_GWB1_46_27]KKU37559.1 MAG: Cytochrome c class I [Candidatus Azambacteria bacterium GW2011_GWF2_46_32]KKU39115.1 MAG: Cytochrome c class I [Candidatus Azambacteria bacterium GW2011_GWB2_46_37]KKU40399.1 MAG: Cytochrome c class I [Candidatus Azambacteria bacterium GW2011_GWE2_46_45]KKU42551.1 MAG: Cytochrome c class I [Candidatus Azambac